MERIRVVIVERDSLTRRNLKETLTRAGYEVAGEFDDGVSALKMIRNLQPDMVLASMNIRAVNGLELAKIIEEGRLAAVVLMVDYAERDIVVKANERWAIPTLVKPFDDYYLFSILEYAYTAFHKMVSLEKEINRLKSDLQSRKMIERAKGILMGQGLTEDEAFRKIQQQSMKKRVSMKEIAQALITMYELTK